MFNFKIYCIIWVLCVFMRYAHYTKNYSLVYFAIMVTRRSHVEQELVSLPEHLSSPQVFSGVRVVRSLVFCALFCRSLFVLFRLVIVLSVLLRFVVYDYPFGFFKLFLSNFRVTEFQICWNNRKWNLLTAMRHTKVQLRD